MTHPIQQQQNPELWKPEGMPEWKVGMRVRVRFSAECDVQCDANSPSNKAGIPTGHTADSEANRKTGIIINIHSARIPKHPFDIKMDVEYEFNNQKFQVVFATASELTLLSDEGRER